MGVTHDSSIEVVVRHKLIAIIDDRISVDSPLLLVQPDMLEQCSAYLVMLISWNGLCLVSMFVPRTEDLRPFAGCSFSKKIDCHDPERLSWLDRDAFDHAAHFHVLGKPL